VQVFAIDCEGGDTLTICVMRYNDLTQWDEAGHGASVVKETIPSMIKWSKEFTI